eukprot:COSAG02_NODE_6989_length_3244_cov_71.039110_5_plen_65_part_00
MYQVRFYVPVTYYYYYYYYYLVLLLLLLPPMRSVALPWWPVTPSIQVQNVEISALVQSFQWRLI